MWILLAVVLVRGSGNAPPYAATTMSVPFNTQIECTNAATAFIAAATTSVNVDSVKYACVKRGN